DGVDLEPDEPAWEVADLGHRAALDRADHRRDRGRGGRRAGRARGRAACAREAVGGRDRPEREAVPGRGRACEPGAGARGLRVAFFGRGGKVGSVLEPALRAAGHGPGEPRGAEGMVDFTAPDAVVGNSTAALQAGVPCVVGTSGWDTADVAAIAEEAGVPVFYAPNFAIGAVLMMRFAQEAAEFLPRTE